MKKFSEKYFLSWLFYFMLLFVSMFTSVWSADELRFAAQMHMDKKLAGQWVHLHNKFRRRVQQGKVGNEPPAKYMKSIKWNQRLANEAARWSQNCKFGHNSNFLDAEGAGENIGYAAHSKYKSIHDIDKRVAIQSCFKGWANEHKDYDYETGSCPHVTGCLHYTQIVRANTSEIGCGVSYCLKDDPEYGRYYGWHCVCDYKPGNAVGKPYKSVTPDSTGRKPTKPKKPKPKPTRPPGYYHYSVHPNGQGQNSNRKGQKEPGSRNRNRSRRPGRRRTTTTTTTTTRAPYKPYYGYRPNPLNQARPYNRYNVDWQRRPQVQPNRYETSSGSVRNLTIYRYNQLSAPPANTRYYTYDYSHSSQANPRQFASRSNALTATAVRSGGATSLRSGSIRRGTIRTGSIRNSGSRSGGIRTNGRIYSIRRAKNANQKKQKKRKEKGRG